MLCKHGSVLPRTLLLGRSGSEADTAYCQSPLVPPQADLGFSTKLQGPVVGRAAGGSWSQTWVGRGRDSQRLQLPGSSRSGEGLSLCGAAFKAPVPGSQRGTPCVWPQDFF